MRKLLTSISVLAATAALAVGCGATSNTASCSSQQQSPAHAGGPCVAAVQQHPKAKGPGAVRGPRGVDSSNWNGLPNWAAAKSNGLSFVYNQTGNGYTYHDYNFAANWSAQKHLGIPHGPYLFVLPQSAEAQANAMYADIQKAGGLDANALPPALDAEVSGAYSQVCPIAEKLKAKLHIPTVVLYTASGLWPYSSPQCSGLVLWAAEWGTNSPYGFGGYPSSSVLAVQTSGSTYNPFGLSGQWDVDVSTGILGLLHKPAPKPAPKPKPVPHRILIHDLAVAIGLRRALRRERLTHLCHTRHERSKYHRECVRWLHNSRVETRLIIHLKKEF